MLFRTYSFISVCFAVIKDSRVFTSDVIRGSLEQMEALSELSSLREQYRATKQ